MKTTYSTGDHVTINGQAGRYGVDELLTRANGTRAAVLTDLARPEAPRQIVNLDRLTAYRPPVVGDIVRVGSGKNLWQIENFFDGWPAGTTLARLSSVKGNVSGNPQHTSVEVDRLVLVRATQVRP